jgi:hypothetical protein
MEDKALKKKIIIIIIVSILLIVLFTPFSIKMYKDGGTRTYTALTYKIVRWNKIINANEIYKKTSIYWLPSNFKSIDELWEIENINENKKEDENNNTVTSVSIVLQNYNSKGLTFIFNNESNKEYIYGEAYKLSVFKDNEWIYVPYIIDNAAFDDIAYTLKENSITEKIDVNWIWLYGELSDGKYKFEKDILFLNSSGEDYESITISEEFELVNGERVKVISYTISKRDKDNKVLIEKEFSSESDMKIISAAYFEARLKSSLVQVDLSKFDDIYNIKATYSNGENSNAILCSESGKAYIIFANKEDSPSSIRMGVQINDKLYQKLINLLDL